MSPASRILAGRHVRGGTGVHGSIPRRRRVLVGIAVAAVLLAAGSALAQVTDLPGSNRPPEPDRSVPAGAGPTAAGPGSTDGPGRGAPFLRVQRTEAAEPVRVRVPEVGVSSRLDRLGLLDDGALEAPPRWQVAGWYAGGPRPGETGPAVIAGHLDSPSGPAVFSRLSDLAVGDRVLVDGADGSVQRFRVTRLATTARDRFPTEVVYGSTPDAELRLITCDGPYDRAAGAYQDNLVVFATAVTRDAPGG